jgi:hypothetical protein
MKQMLTIMILAAIALTSAANADHRKYVWTYQYGTLPPDAAELEFYQTTKLDETNSWEYRIEIEHGLTPDWDMSVYQIFAQKEGESFKWDAVQVRTRYRLAPYGQFFMDPLLYLEYRRKVDLKQQNKFEAKLILAKDAERVNVALNPVYEFFWAPGEPKHEIGIDVGISYSPSLKYSIGLESTTRHEIVKNGNNETGSYLGPTVSFASGPIWYTFGFAWGLTDSSNDARARFLMGVEL